MTLTFVTNLVHHHQLPLADEFYRLLGNDYRYIATQPLPDWLIKGGYDPTLDRPYIVRTYQSNEAYSLARKLINDSDVVIVGAGPDEWVYQRKKQNKVTFHFSERWIRRVDLHIISPKALRGIYKNYFQFRHSRTYMLCASAYTAHDVHLYGCFPNRCFKWGYLTAVNYLGDSININIPDDSLIRIMWCARFLKLKHPELPVKLAKRLKDSGYRFELNMFGSGEEEPKIRALIKQLDVADKVNLCGNRPNQEILAEMRKHNIFLFTSDRNEGWGAVLNEAMSSGCVPVASDAIGSVPFLVDNGVNGMVFSSCNLDSLEDTVRYLLDAPQQLQLFSREALNTMQNVWSPKIGANNFLELAQHALQGTLNQYTRMEGPASWVV